MDIHISKDVLSKRENQIMQLVSAGKFNKEIALELKIKPDTIAKNLQKVFQKYNVQNRTEATLKFLEKTGRIKFL